MKTRVLSAFSSAIPSLLFPSSILDKRPAGSFTIVRQMQKSLTSNPDKAALGALWVPVYLLLEQEAFPPSDLLSNSPSLNQLWTRAMQPHEWIALTVGPSLQKAITQEKDTDNTDKWTLPSYCWRPGGVCSAHTPRYWRESTGSRRKCGKRLFPGMHISVLLLFTILCCI